MRGPFTKDREERETCQLHLKLVLKLSAGLPQVLFVFEVLPEVTTDVTFGDHLMPQIYLLNCLWV
jgi:hypothetical protein